MSTEKKQTRKSYLVEVVVIVTCRNVHLVGMREENERESVVVVIVMYSDVSVKMQILYRNPVHHQVSGFR